MQREGETIKSICVKIQRSGDGDDWGIISRNSLEHQNTCNDCYSLLNVSNTNSKNSRMPLVYIQLLILTAVLGGKIDRDYHPILDGEAAEVQRQSIPYCQSCRH